MNADANARGSFDGTCARRGHTLYCGFEAVIFSRRRCRHQFQGIHAEDRQGKQESVSSYSSRFRNVLLKLQSIDGYAHSAAAIVLWYTEGQRSELQAELERYATETHAEVVNRQRKQNEFGSDSTVRRLGEQKATRSLLRRYRNLRNATTVYARWSNKEKLFSFCRRRWNHPSSQLSLPRHPTLGRDLGQWDRVSIAKEPSHTISECAKRLAKEAGVAV